MSSPSTSSTTSYRSSRCRTSSTNDVFFLIFLHLPFRVPGRCFVLGCLLLLSPLFVTAQDSCRYVVSGRVTDADGVALPGAAVLLSRSVGVTTDNTGVFTFDRVCRGRYFLIVRYLGYAEWRDTIPVPGPELSVTLTIESRQLQNVIIEDSRSHASISQTESVLSGKQLEMLAGRSLGEVLKSMPGVTTLQTGPNLFKPVIHGLHSSRLLILNNGVRLEGQQWGADHAPEIDPFTASSMSVIKDATAIKYGSDALAGVILVNPPELPSTPGIGGDASLIGSTNGRMGVFSGGLEGSFKKLRTLGWRVQGTLRRGGDFHAADYQLTNTGLREAHLSGAVGYHSDRSALELYLSHYSGDFGILRGSVTGNLEDLARAMETEPPAYTTDFSYTMVSPRQTAQHDFVRLKGHHHLDNDQVLRFQYGLQLNQRLEFDVRRGNLNDIPSIDLQLVTQTFDGEWEHVHLDRRLGSAGFNLIFQDNENKPGTQRIPFVPNFQNVTAGIFLAEQWPAGRWTIEAGARCDFRTYDVRGRDFQNELYSSQYLFGNISGTAGGRYEVTSRSNFRSNIGVAWRPPNVAELYSFGLHQSVGAVEYGLLLDKYDNQVMDPDSADIHPETAVKWVNTYSLQTSQLRAEFTGYASVINHFIYLRPGGVTTTVRGAFPFFRYSQANALFAGLDGFFSWEMTKQLLLEAKVSLLRARDVENDDELLYIPANQGQLTFQYMSPKLGSWQDGLISVGVQFVARQTHAPRTITVSDFIDSTDTGGDPLGGDDSNFDFASPPASYFLGSVRAGISHLAGTGKVSFRIEVTNLLNQDYREYTNRMRYYADDLGRNLLVAVKYVF